MKVSLAVILCPYRVQSRDGCFIAIIVHGTIMMPNVEGRRTLSHLVELESPPLGGQSMSDPNCMRPGSTKFGLAG